MTTSFFSDPHFGHANILEYAQRPFATIDEHDAVLVLRYREDVGPDDLVIWCGDAFLCDHRHAEKIMQQLPGRKILLLGNHDKSAGAMAALGFEFVTDRLTMQIAGRDVVVSHYPYQGTLRSGGRVDTRYGHLYPPRRKGCAIIHGHTHQKERAIGTAIHVGVDAWGYRPVPLDSVARLISAAFGGREQV